MIKRVIASLIAICLLLPSYAVMVFADQKDVTTIDMQMQPLRDRLAAMSEKDKTDAAGKFKDVSNHWGKEYIAKLSYLRIVNGCGNDMFLPNGNVTIAQFIIMTTRALGYSFESTGKNYADPYIKQAKADGIIREGQYNNYDKAITREQMAEMLFNADMLKTAQPDQTLYKLVANRIADYYKISDMKKQVVVNDYILGLLAGSSQKFYFNPQSNLTRAEACVVIIRLLDDKSREVFPVSPDDTITLPTAGGKTVTVYPPSRPEVIKTANFLVSNMTKDSGYVFYGYNSQTGQIPFGFYESKDKYENGSVFDINMGISIETAESLLKFPYSITIYDAEKVKSIHRDLLVSLFRYWFGNDSKKAIEQLDYYLSISNNNSLELKKVFKFNNREVQFNKFVNNTGFVIGISSEL